MRVAFVSYEWGPYAGPEGIVSERLATALAREGIQVECVTARGNLGSPGPNMIYVPSWPIRPNRVQRLVGRAMHGVDTPHWRWIRAAGGAPIASADVIYARGNPLSSLIAAAHLADRYARPLIIHLSDPIPCPWDTDPADVKRKERAMGKILAKARHVTVTTEEAETFIRRTFPNSLPSVSVVRNVVPEWPRTAAESPQDRTFQILYAGTFSEERNPRLFTEALTRVAQARGLSVCFAAVGSQPHWNRVIRERLGACCAFRSSPRTSEISAEYHSADVSLVIDADDKYPVFLATKAAESVRHGRRVLFITPERSPARRLFEMGWRSVRFATHDPQSITDALNGLLDVDNAGVAEDIPSRSLATCQFTAKEVAASFMLTLATLGLSRASGPPAGPPESRSAATCPFQSPVIRKSGGAPSCDRS